MAGADVLRLGSASEQLLSWRFLLIWVEVAPQGDLWAQREVTVMVGDSKVCQGRPSASQEASLMAAFHHLKKVSVVLRLSGAPQSRSLVGGAPCEVPRLWFHPQEVLCWFELRVTFP